METKSIQSLKIRLHKVEYAYQDLFNKFLFLNNKFEELNTKLKDLDNNNSTDENDSGDKTLETVLNKQLSIDN
jgi:hypothetical protein